MADYSSYVTAGLGGAQTAIQNNKNPAYPTYTGDQKANPYANQQTVGAYQGPNFQASQAQYNGLGGVNQIRNDYTASANQAWDKTQSQIASRFGANGLYGSRGGGLMSGALQDGAQNYMTGMAQANTLANQVAMQDEQNRIKSILDANTLQGNQALDAWKAGLQQTDYNNQLLGNRANFANSQIDAAYNDALARRNDSAAWDQRQIESYLGLAGGGTPNASAQLSANAQADAARRQAQSANQSAWLGAGGSVLGGLLSGAGDAGGFGKLFSFGS